MEVVKKIADKNFKIDPEDVCEEISGKLESFVHVMVLVRYFHRLVHDVDVLFEELAEVVRLQDALILRCAEMR